MGMTIKDFAQVIGRSTHTVNSLESGRLDLSPELAATISRKTGVFFGWLLDETKHGPPVNPDMKAMTGEDFERNLARDAARDIMVGDTMHIYPDTTAVMAEKLRAILERMETRRDFVICLYRVDQFLKKLEQDFPLPSKASESSQKRP